jgi:hypothetical protein
VSFINITLFKVFFSSLLNITSAFLCGVNTHFANVVFSFVVAMSLTVQAINGDIVNRPTIVQHSSCSCEIGGSIVDLTPLGFKNNTPR